MAAASTLTAADAAAPTTQTYRFAAGARERFSGIFSDLSSPLGATQVALPLIDIAPGDFTAGVYLQVTADATGNVADAAFQADGPFSALQLVELLDPQGTTFQSYTGWELMMWNQIGGWTGQGDPLNSPNYVATTGTGDDGGSFGFMLRIPAELFPRDGAATLFNGSTAAQFKVRVTIAPSSAVYSTAPTALPTVRLRVTSHGYQVPNASGPNSGTPYAVTPPGGQIYQNFYRQAGISVNQGDNIIYFTRKSFLYRQIAFVFRDSDGNRADDIAPNTHVVRIDNVEVFAGNWALAKQITWERNRWASGADVPTGMWGLSWCYDWDGLNGGETRDQYVPTQPGSICEYRFTAAESGTLTILYNDVSLTDEAIRLGMMKV